MNSDDLKPFLALIRQGGLSGPARSLRVERATIARRIVRLEAALGLKLFDRLARGWRPTPEASAPVEKAEAAAGRGRSGCPHWAGRGAGDRAVSGLLRPRIAACRGCSPVAPFVFDTARRQSARLARSADFVAEVLTKTFRSER